MPLGDYDTKPHGGASETGDAAKRETPFSRRLRPGDIGSKRVSGPGFALCLLQCHQLVPGSSDRSVRHIKWEKRKLYNACTLFPLV